MRKYIIGLTLAIAMLFALTACGGGNDTTTVQTEPEYEYNNHSETVTVRFYYHSTEIDPNIYALPEAFLYNSVEIPVENLREEFMRLMYEHIGVRIQDYWLEGSKLYIDLHEDAIGFFDHHGTTGGTINTTVFEKTILSLPGTITSFEVLVNGQRGVHGNHFNFGHIAIVENGEVVDREFFDLPDIENSAASQGSGIPANTYHPFAAALLEYFAGGMSQEDMHAREELTQASWMGPITKAILVDIDDAGTPGMLALRLISPDGHPVPMLRLFALYNGEVSYVDVGDIYATDMYVTVDGRVIEAMYHWGSCSYTLFGVENGRLVRTFGIHVMLNEDIDDLESEYSYFTGGLWENAQSITREEFEDIRIRHGLDNLIPWDVEPDIGLRHDETELILAMTFE